MAYTSRTSLTKKQAAILHALCHTNTEQRKALIRAADKALIKSIAECCLNVLSGGINLKNTEKSRLKKHKTVLRKLVTTKKKFNWRKKKQTILQSGTGFLPILLAPLASILLNKIFSRTNQDE